MKKAVRLSLAGLIAGMSLEAQADAITDWNTKASEFVIEAKLGTPPAVRVMALVQTAVYEATNAITRRYPAGTISIAASPDANVDAAVAAAYRASLVKLMPAVQPSIDTAYQAALAKIADGSAKTAGIAVGEKAAEAVLAQRANDGATTPESYRPHAVPGVYVPTAAPAVPQWAQRKPWLMASASQFRPGPPPALGSAAWAREVNEVKELGGRQSAKRTPAQAEVAKFWEYSLPSIYYGVVLSVANEPGRDTTQNARLFAGVSQAMDDALIAVFDAKYHYNFWRPTTAIRNADIDNNDATEREASWAPYIDVPMHPEYPSGHSILAGAVSTIIKAEVGANAMPALATSSPTAKGATRRWSSVEAFTQEVSMARIYGGLHYRVSTEVAESMGRQIGALAAQRFAQN